MPQRTVIATVRAEETAEGAGARVKRAIPSAELGVLDPFVLLDEFMVGAGAGFPEHPHRGFEIITYVLEGGFGHKDSLGNDSMVGAGGLQKINTGRGLYHSEMPAQAGRSSGLQLWINLARDLKGLEPEYQGVPAAQIPETSGDGWRQRTIVGPDSPVTLHTPVLYLDATVEPGGDWHTDVPDDFRAFVYVLHGAGRFGNDGQVGRGGQLLALGPGDSFGAQAAGQEPVRFAFIAGRPHNEPIRMRGPYVD